MVLRRVIKMLFKTERLTIEPLDGTDKINSGLLGQIPKILTSKVTQGLPSDWQPIDNEASTLHWLENRLSEGNICSVSQLSSKQVFGFLFLYKQKVDQESEELFREVRIGYLLAEHCWGNGFGSELVAGLVRHCKELGNISCLIGGVEVGNLGSIRVLTNNGFELKETSGDTVIYQLGITN